MHDRGFVVFVDKSWGVVSPAIRVTRTGALIPGWIETLRDEMEDELDSQEVMLVDIVAAKFLEIASRNTRNPWDIQLINFEKSLWKDLLHSNDDNDLAVTMNEYMHSEGLSQTEDAGIVLVEVDPSENHKENRLPWKAYGGYLKEYITLQADHSSMSQLKESAESFKIAFQKCRIALSLQSNSDTSYEDTLNDVLFNLIEAIGGEDYINQEWCEKYGYEIVLKSEIQNKE